MQNLRTIKVFLASSEELGNDRDAIGNLVRRLNKVYEKRGIHVELFEWEDYDASFSGRRKQDEYNDEVRASDMFVALFHIQAGKYTLEEFDVATDAFNRTGKNPKPYVYCRDLANGERESAELAEFKQRLFKEMGHYWCRYGSKDSLQLQFALQVQLLIGTSLDEVKVEDGMVTIDGLPIARLQGETITDRMRRAIEALEKGQVQEANIIIDEAVRDAERNMEWSRSGSPDLLESL